MEYLKPKYKVVELTYLEISTHFTFDFEIDEPRLETKTNVITRLFKIGNPKNPYGEFREFIPYRCYMSQATLECIEKINYDSNKITIIRVDTGDIIEEKPIPNSYLQEDIFDDEEVEFENV